MACGCNGGKPVNLRTPQLPPKVDPNVVANQAKIVRQTLARSDFVKSRSQLIKRLNG
jgi:hypothetical protein